MGPQLHARKVGDLVLFRKFVVRMHVKAAERLRHPLLPQRQTAGHNGAPFAVATAELAYRLERQVLEDALDEVLKREDVDRHWEAKRSEAIVFRAGVELDASCAREYHARARRRRRGVRPL